MCQLEDTVFLIQKAMLILAHSKESFLGARFEADGEGIITAQGRFEFPRVDGQRTVEVCDRRLVDLPVAFLHVAEPDAHKLFQQNLALLVQERDLSSRIDATSDPAVSDRGGPVAADRNFGLLGALSGKEGPVFVFEGRTHRASDAQTILSPRFDDQLLTRILAN